MSLLSRLERSRQKANAFPTPPGKNVAETPIGSRAETTDDGGLFSPLSIPRPGANGEADGDAPAPESRGGAVRDDASQDRPTFAVVGGQPDAVEAPAPPQRNDAARDVMVPGDDDEDSVAPASPLYVESAFVEHEDREREY